MTKMKFKKCQTRIKVQKKIDDTKKKTYQKH